MALSEEGTIQASANTIYNIVEGAWDTSVCGGGGVYLVRTIFSLPTEENHLVWWSSAKDYKNCEVQLYICVQGLIGLQPSPTNFFYWSRPLVPSISQVIPPSSRTQTWLVTLCSHQSHPHVPPPGFGLEYGKIGSRNSID
jgi:hypothetical protein